MYLEITTPQLILAAYAAIFSYVLLGSLISAIMHTLSGDNIHVIAQIHITLLWPLHLVLVAVSLVRMVFMLLGMFLGITGPNEED